MLTTEKQTGVMLAERLGLKIIGTEGHDLKCACVSCQSSDAGRIHQDNGVFYCHSCQKSLNAFDLCKVTLGDHKGAIDTMVAVGLYKPSNGNGVGNISPTSDILETIAKQKGCTAAGFLAYGAKVDGQKIVFPMYGQDCQPCSSFSLTGDGGKGLYEKGKPVGLFLPKQPEAGETWHLVEGVKDAAALHGLGYKAAGLPSSAMNEKFAPLFDNTDVVIVPDADKPGQNGAARTATNLAGVARSVRIANLPAEVKESKGDDVRDVLRDQGPEAVHKAIAEAVAVGGEKEAPAFTKMITGGELLAMDLKPNFLIRGVLVEGQPMIMGGRSKTLKTSIVCDLAISLGSGTPFLGKFDSHQVAVGFWSGESGAATIRESAKRIAADRGVNLADCQVFWNFALPKLSRVDHLEHLRATIERHGLKVVIIDPLYLALLNAETAGSASNLFAMGAALQPLGELATAAGVTLIVLHHFRKGGQPNEDEPAGLEELTMSGAAEWARQWLLLQRRSKYQDDGRHELWMRCGGSAGHASLWGVTIEEGHLNPETFSGRTWDVTVAPAAEARETVKRDNESRKAADQEKRDGEQRDRLLTVLRSIPGGNSERALSKAAGLNPANFYQAMTCLLREGRAEECKVIKRGVSYEGYKPTDK